MSPNVPATREQLELVAIEAAIEPHVERIQAAAADAFAPNTRRAYRTAWAAFARWADGEGLQAIPAAPAAVAAYLAARSEAGRSLSSLHLAQQAIRATAAGPRAGPTGRTESPETARIRGAVDVALASVMRDAMLRRSEAAALEWADVELRPDGSGRLTIRRSKTD